MINRHLAHLWRQMKIYRILTHVCLHQIGCLCYCCYAKTSSSAVQKRHNKVYGKLSPPPSIQFSLSMTTLIRQRFKRITVVNQICRSLIIEESQTCLQPRYNGGDPGITLNCFPPSAITLWLGQVPDDPYILQYTYTQQPQQESHYSFVKFQTDFKIE